MPIKTVLKYFESVPGKIGAILELHLVGMQSIIIYYDLLLFIMMIFIYYYLS